MHFKFLIKAGMGKRYGYEYAKISTNPFVYNFLE